MDHNAIDKMQEDLAQGRISALTLVAAIRYHKDGSGFPIVAPFTAEKLGGNRRKWLIYGRREGVSAVVLCQACNLMFSTKRDCMAYIAAHFSD